MSVLTPLAVLLSQLTTGLRPLLGDSAAAAAIVLFTVCVRLALHPLARAAARGERARARLAPRIAELNARHRKDPRRLQREMAELSAREGVSPLAGCLPALVQIPCLWAVYRLFSASGDPTLLAHRLWGTPLGERWLTAVRDGGVLGPHGLVFLGLFAVAVAVATWSFRRARHAADEVPRGLARVVPLLPFGTLLTAAVVPLATGVYVVTAAAWTAAERALLHRSS